MKKDPRDRPIYILIPDGESNYAISVVRCLAKVKNIKTIVVSNNKYSEVRFSRYPSKFIFDPSGENKDEKLEKLIYHIKKTNADLLLPIDIEMIRLVADSKEEISKLISISPVPPINSFDTSDDKWLLSLWLQEKNIPHPHTTLFNTKSNLQEVLSAISFPAIIKPRKGSGSRGIEIVNDVEEFERWNSNSTLSEDLIVQPFISGYDIDCSVVCSDGKILAHTIQKSLKYKVDQYFPYGLEFLENEEILTIVKEVVNQFNWSGVVHIDLRYDEVEEKIKLIEMNPRFWASVSASLFAGVNFPYLSCLSGLNREIPIVKTQNKRVVRSGPALNISASRFFNKQNDLYYDNTFLEIIIKDPLPNIFSKILEKLNDWKSNIAKNRQ